MERNQVFDDKAFCPQEFPQIASFDSREQKCEQLLWELLLLLEEMNIFAEEEATMDQFYNGLSEEIFEMHACQSWRNSTLWDFGRDSVFCHQDRKITPN